MLLLQKESRIQSSLKKETLFSLCPTDSVSYIRTTSICWPLFFQKDLDAERLLRALKQIETKYPLLCGRLQRTTGGQYAIEVSPHSHNGFGFVEIRSDASLAELKSSRRMNASLESGAPQCMDWPFYLDDLTSTTSVDCGSLMGVHLVHARDGCVMSVAIRHVLCDGERYTQLMIDISRAYRGLALDSKQLVRDFYWPDRYIYKFPASKSRAQKYPRDIVMSAYTPKPTQQRTSISTVHISQTAIDKLKTETKSKLKDVDYVSTNDLISGLYWLFRAECLATSHPVIPSTLPIQNTTILIPISATRTAFPIVPKNFFGNAIVDAFVTNASPSTEAATFIELLANAASQIHKTVKKIRTCPETNLQSLLQYYRMAIDPQGSQTPKLIAVIASYAKMRFRKIDFGNAGPAHVHGIPTFPSNNIVSTMNEGPKGDGILMYMCLNEKERRVLETSQVFAVCLPMAKIYSTKLNVFDACEIMGVPKP